MESTFIQNLHLQWAPTVSDINWIKNSTSKGLLWTPPMLRKVSWCHFSNFHGLQWTPQYVCYLFTCSSVNWVLIYHLQWTPMVSNDMAKTWTNSTSLPPLDSNQLRHMLNSYFDLSRDFYYKTPTKMDSQGLQQFMWKVSSLKSPSPMGSNSLRH